jgi:hypothetical protein
VEAVSVRRERWCADRRQSMESVCASPSQLPSPLRSGRMATSPPGRYNSRPGPRQRGRGRRAGAGGATDGLLASVELVTHSRWRKANLYFFIP